MLMPLLMDITTDDYKTVQKLGFFDHVYLNTGKKILKFKLEIDDHMAVVDALESCINNTNINDFAFVSKKEAKEIWSWQIKFLPYVGNYRLPGNYKKTDNYAIPVMTTLMSLLRNMNFDFNTEGYCVVTGEQLLQLADIIVDSEDNRNSLIIDNLLKHLKVTLVSEYDADIESLINNINNVSGLLNGYYGGGRDELYGFGYDAKSFLKYVLNQSQTNIENIKMLCIQDKFINAVKENKEKQKVKSI